MKTKNNQINKPSNNNPEERRQEPPFIKIFGKSKLARIFAVIFLVLIFLFLVTNLKTYILGLVIIFLPLFLAVVSCSIVNPIARFFATILKISFRWFTYIIYLIYLIFIFFICFVVIEVFFVQWTPFINSFLGNKSSVLKLIQFLGEKDNINSSFSSINFLSNGGLSILLSNGQKETFLNLGSIYILFFKIINFFVHSISVNIVHSFINSFYNKVSIFASGPFGLLYKLSPILLSIGIIIVFTVVITIIFLNKYNTKISKWVSTKFWENKINQQKVEKVFDQSIKAWSQALIIDEAIIFSIILLTVILAGNIGKSQVFLHSFIIFPIFMAICCLVPIVGPVVGTIPMLIVSVIEISANNNYAPLIIVCIGVIIAISLEALVVSPIIYSKTTKLNMVTILLGISVFGLILGVWAMPFSVPLIMMFKEICNQIYNINLKI